jgi:tRNA (cmo5U34)-methyltransferase
MTEDISESFTPGGWKFTPEVTDVFDEHVTASVPFYPMIQDIVAETADWLLPNNGVYVDIGASTGTTAAAIADRHPDRRIRSYLYDEVPDMLHKAIVKLSPYKNLVVERRAYNVTATMDHIPSDLVTSLFTLQFIAPELREGVLRDAHRRSKKSGALILAEKIRLNHALWAEIAIDASHDFKADHGLSDTAIRQKAKALRGVLRPSSEAEILDMLDGAGWRNPTTLFRWHQWMVLAVTAS